MKKKVIHTKSTKKHIFNDVNKQKNIIISHNHFIYQDFNYQNYEQFKETFERIFQNFKRLYNPISCNRLGLRYINELNGFKGNPLKWNDIINEALTCFLDNFIDEQGGGISREMTQAIFNKENFKLNFNFGIFNSEFPSSIVRKEFILDYDCYTTEIETNDISDRLDNFHLEIQNLFEKSIKDKLREIMGENKS